MKLFPSLISTLMILSTSNAQIVPDSRLSNWNAGIPNGIPDYSSTIINAVSDYGAVNDSSADASVAIQNALDAANPNSVVYLPEGTYRLDNQLSFNSDNIALIGAGPSKTKLYSSYDGSSITILKYNRGTFQNLLGGASKGSTTFNVEDGSQFTVGQFAEVQQDNDPTLMYTDPEWNQSWAANAVGQVFEVKAITGNTITTTNPLHYDVRMDLNPQIRPQGLRKYCGVEDLYIEKLSASNSSANHTIEIKNAAYTWVRRVHSNMTRRSHINVTTGIGHEFRENLLHHSWFYGGGGSAYGVELGMHATDILTEDNIFYHLRHSMMVHLGAIGNVFAYNYSFDAVQGENGDEGSLNVGWDPPDISLHGHWAQYNLFESNDVVEVGIGDHWGPMGPGNTFLRNIVDGSQDGIYLLDASVDQNIIGNVADALDDRGNATGTIVHGNDFGSGIQWDPTITDQNIPVSYYLSSKPWFWGSQAWPVSGADYSGNEVIPAHKRWLDGTPFVLDTALEITSIEHNKGDLFKVVHNQSQLNLSKSQSNSSSNISVKLYNLKGELIFKDNWSSNNLKITLPKGVSILKVDSQSFKFTNY